MKFNVREGNIGGRSCINCCYGKAICITHSGSVFIVSVILHAMRVRHIVACGLTALP